VPSGSRAWLAILALLLTACGGGASADSADCDRIAGVRPGLCPVPEEDRVEAPTDEMPVLGASDESISLEDYRGRVVVLNFWASWCAPCRVEQPDLNTAHASLPEDDVAFVGVNIEETGEANGLAHQNEFEIPYPSMFDPANDLAAGFGSAGPRVPPSTLFLDRDGRVAARIFGLVGTGEVIGMADHLAQEG
jgi:thiol-disulfide isomerase/thioredoxin